MEPGLPTRPVDLKELRPEQLPPKTGRAFTRFVNDPPLDLTPWYLADGTALTLQAGHRQSVDLDFFTRQADFDTTDVDRNLIATGVWQTTLRERGTLNGEFLGAQISFIAYPFFMPARPLLMCGNLPILDKADIAVMKIVAISQRGRKRDFVDLFWYCTELEQLADILPRVLEQYPNQKHNVPHFLKSLTYFADAESDPMPELFFDATWADIKTYFQTEVPRLARAILDLGV